jgi:hypothetical protein
VIILNSSPVLHLAAGLGDLDILPSLYGPVVVPAEVVSELEFGAALDDAAVQVRRTVGIDTRSLGPAIDDERRIFNVLLHRAPGPTGRTGRPLGSPELALRRLGIAGL